jgi:hypothetical protein
LEAIDVAAAHTVGDIAGRGVNGRWVRRKIEDGCDLGGEIEVMVRCLTERRREDLGRKGDDVGRF